MAVLRLGEDHPSAKAVYSGKFCYRGLVPMEKARELLGDEQAMNAQMYLGDHGHMLTFAVEKGSIMNGAVRLYTFQSRNANRFASCRVCELEDVG